MSIPIIPTVVKSASQLARAFNLQNVRIIQPQKSNYIVPEGATPDPQLYSSLLGTSVLVDLTFLAQTYTNELGQQRSFADITLETVLLSVNQSKEIVKTKVQGRAGTVKEYISLGDYEVTIAAILTGTNGVYPKSDVQDMLTMLQCNNAVSVVSWYLDLFGINSIVIDSFDINQDEGAYSRQAISVTASSDTQANLRFM